MSGEGYGRRQGKTNVNLHVLANELTLLSSWLCRLITAQKNVVNIKMLITVVTKISNKMTTVLTMHV